MVQTGVTRAFGLQLRRMLGYALGNRFKAFLAGMGATAVLQQHGDRLNGYLICGGRPHRSRR